MSDHYCCKICGQEYGDCTCKKASSKAKKPKSGEEAFHIEPLEQQRAGAGMSFVFGPAKPKEVKLSQLVIAPFTTPTGSSYSVLGLSTDGAVYRYDPQCEGWIPWSMTVAECRLDHKAKR